MLNPKLLTNAIVSSLQGITALVAAMNGDASRIQAHHYLYGAEFRIEEALYKLTPPTILVVWEGTQGGNFSGYQIWKHRFCCYIRAANVAGQSNPTTYEDLWWLICNSPVSTVSPGTINLRYINIYSGVDIMETPSIVHLKDEDRMDYFAGHFVLPEIGDN